MFPRIKICVKKLSDLSFNRLFCASLLRGLLNVIHKYCMTKFETGISITLGKNEHNSSIMRIARHELAFCTCVTNARNLSCISQDLPFARLVYNYRCFHYLKKTKKEFSDCVWMLLQYSHLIFSYKKKSLFSYDK